MNRIIAGHAIRPLDDRCDKCGRSLNDIMSGAEGAKPGDEHVACFGRLNSVEIDQLQQEKARRARIWDMVVGVST
jgi:hypothetical protein